MGDEKRGELKLIENEAERMATFNRLMGEIIQEAAELSELAEGFQVAIAGFTPTGEPFAFGNPSSEALNHFLEEAGGSRKVQRLFRGSSENSSQVEKLNELEDHLGQENQNKDEDDHITIEFEWDAQNIAQSESVDELEAMEEEIDLVTEAIDKRFAEKRAIDKQLAKKP